MATIKLGTTKAGSRLVNYAEKRAGTNITFIGKRVNSFDRNNIQYNNSYYCCITGDFCFKPKK